jgi:predicted DNA-binding transcriptional regulator YafY
MSKLLKRYIWLIDTISRAGILTLEDINSQWCDSTHYDGKDIPPRTFHDHREAIDELFGIRIVCNKFNYQYSIEDNKEFKRNDVKRWLLETFSVSNMLCESEKIKDRIVVEDVPSAQTHLTDIIYAMRQNVKISICYHPYDGDRQNEIVVSPYFIKMHERRWYMYGKPDHRKDEMRTYALDCIKRLTFTQETFTLPSGFSPEEYLCNVVGIRKDATLPCTIRIKAYGKHAKYLQSLPLHHSQQKVETHKDYVIFTYWLCPNDEFYQEILAQREYIEILEPAYVRRKAKEILLKIEKYYK